MVVSVKTNMQVDGRAIAQEMKEDLKRKFAVFSSKPIMALVSAGENPATETFIRIKTKFAEDIGVEVTRSHFDENASTEIILAEVCRLNADPSVAGIVVQLPLPSNISVSEVLHVIAPEKDIDALGTGVEREGREKTERRESKFLPPVVLAVKEIFKREKISPEGKTALVVGKGRLVGKPVFRFLQEQGAEVSVVEEGQAIAPFSECADIIVSGAGSPGIIRPEMIKDECVLIDAGTSESAGKVRGDADPSCASKCAVFTPVPGGVGPITVACLFANLYQASISGDL
ncbi:MAG TPA: bifunctional 5,10-methylenetetrahydrofolate dehydrogenase/5,10-methenyltetrahydrofolate cyclohydrolase [Candidatus Paceibacterota bacterium]|nr:bifunctional 5,10-methylenetetrahydrofolate dehydrogenase/5,10-methenyltetrahydrofolate cyclohydrolase [Candidatus Paceibacterota bacterium]